MIDYTAAAGKSRSDDTARGTRATIDLAALRHNAQVVRQPGKPLMAIVKADAYGHGIEQVVGALDDVDGFGVATIREANRVRKVARNRPILLLEGALDQDALMTASRLDLWVTIHSEWQIDLLESSSLPRPVTVWLKVDTGMNRLGFKVADAQRAADRLHRCKNVASRIILMSHLANADDLTDATTLLQIDRFEKVCQLLPDCSRSMANSAGSQGWARHMPGWQRVGLALYGASPLQSTSSAELGLQPVMTLRSRVIAMRDVAAGECVGYGGHWTATSDTRIAVVAIGYGDGYPRSAANGTPVLIGDQVFRLAGRVSMDMLTVDVGLGGTVAIGDVVTLWGDGLPIDRIAWHAGMIAYELMCGITHRVDVEWLSNRS